MGEKIALEGGEAVLCDGAAGVQNQLVEKKQIVITCQHRAEYLPGLK